MKRIEIPGSSENSAGGGGASHLRLFSGHDKIIGVLNASHGSLFILLPHEPSQLKKSETFKIIFFCYKVVVLDNLLLHLNVFLVDSVEYTQISPLRFSFCSQNGANDTVFFFFLVIR